MEPVTKSSCLEPGDSGESDLDSVGTLVRAVIAGRMEAYGLLYDRYVRLVHSVCFDTTGRIDEIEDLVQEVFLRGYCNLSHLRQPDKFGAWLLGITHRVCKDWQRRRGRDRHLFVGLGLDPSVFRSSTSTVEDDSRVRLGEAIRDLPEKERVVLHLFYLQQQPVDEARLIVGLSRSGFYRVLERARKRLQRMLQQKERSEP